MPTDHDPPGARRGEAAPGARWQGLPTEARHPASAELDRMPAAEIAALLLEEDRRGLASAGGALAGIALAAEWLGDSYAGGGTILFAGAGTSGRLGVLEAAECPPTFGTDPQRIRAVIAGGPEAVFAAREGAEDSAEEGRRAAAELSAGDLLIGISASSVTAYVGGAIEAARARGARTVLLTCAAAEGVGSPADLVLALDTGPEVLTGSTRLKAGSATKAVLNAITTAAMVRAGKVFENLMVDLRPGSAKLEDRALRIVQAAGAVSRNRAGELLRKSGGEIKTAIVMTRGGVDVEAARRLLAATDGHVGAAIERATAAG